MDLGLQARYFHPNYAEEIIGVGQENVGDKHEVAQGLGELEISASGTMSDGNYFLVGSDVNGMSVSNTVYPFISNRIERTYAFTRTGEAFATTLRIQASDLIGLNEVNLIMTESEGFNFSSPLQVYPMTLVGDVYEVTLQFPTSGVFTIGETPAINVIENALNQVSIFPVPANNKLNINIGHNVLNDTFYAVYTTDGKQVLSGRITSAQQQIDLTSIAAGFYVLHIQDKGSVVKRDFVKL
jgi:hypothetical protein